MPETLFWNEKAKKKKKKKQQQQNPHKKQLLKTNCKLSKCLGRYLEFDHL